jgi:hypothetical protein
MIIEVRTVIHFFDPLGTPDENILAQLDSAHREGIVNLKPVQRWTSKFRNGKTNLDDELKPSQPRRNENCR